MLEQADLFWISTVRAAGRREGGVARRPLRRPFKERMRSDSPSSASAVVVSVWSRCGLGVVSVWSRVVSVWSRVVSVWSRCGLGIVARSCGDLRGHSRVRRRRKLTAVCGSSLLGSGHFAPSVAAGLCCVLWRCSSRLASVGELRTAQPGWRSSSSSSECFWPASWSRSHCSFGAG